MKPSLVIAWRLHCCC